MRGHITWLAALPLGLLASLAFADPADRPGQTDAEGGTLSVTFENDLFGDTDQYYTNGARLSYVSPRNRLPWLGRVARRNLGWLTDAQDWYATYAIGQNIYTPEDISRRIPDPNDRPYAGFSYVSFGVVADQGDRLDTLAIDVGVIGEAAQADDIQGAVHDIFGLTDPAGWDHQLYDEPGFRLLYERKYRFGTGIDLGIMNLQADAAPHFGVALGNVDTSAAAGLTVRLGEDLRETYGPPRVRPALAGPGFFDGDGSFDWYLFAGAEARVVGRNLFLEGNTFRDSPGVDPERLVGDMQVGIALQFRDFEFAYTHVLRTPEFQGQDGLTQFGSFSVSTKF